MDSPFLWRQPKSNFIEKQNPAPQGFVFVLGINDKENYVLLNELCFIK